jgi:hypothetical protein
VGHNYKNGCSMIKWIFMKWRPGPWGRGWGGRTPSAWRRGRCWTRRRGRPGTDVLILKIFSQKNWRFLLTIMRKLDHNIIFFAEKCRKSPNIVIKNIDPCIVSKYVVFNTKNRPSHHLQAKYHVTTQPKFDNTIITYVNVCKAMRTCTEKKFCRT